MIDEIESVYAVPARALPNGWRTATLPDLIGETGIFIDGDWIESKDQDPSGDVRLIQLADIGDGFYRDRSDRFLTSENAKLLRCTILQPGDMLVARMPDPLGRACIFPGDRKAAVTVVDVAVVRTNNPQVNPRWLMYCVNAPQFRSAVASLQSGSTRLRISRKNLSKVVFPFPPRAVQDEIVAEIEKQFSRLDEAVANLQRVQANLKRYKASVLREFFDSKASGWRKCQLKAVCQVISGFAFKSTDFSPKGVPVVKIANIGYGEFHWKDQEYLPSSFLESQKAFAIQPRDLLMALTRPITNGTLKVCLYPHDGPLALLNQRVAVLRVGVDLQLEFLLLMMQSAPFKNQLQEALSETLQPNLSPVDLKNFEISIPPRSDQARIVAEVDRKLSIIREVEAEVDTNLQRAQALRQSILHMSFAA